MAEGLRVMSANPDHANKTIIIMDPTRITGHNGLPKTYYIPLDGQASAIVSETVWRRLQAVMALSPQMPTLVLVGVVGSPPTMRAGGDLPARPSLYLGPSGIEQPCAPIAVPVSF